MKNWKKKTLKSSREILKWIFFLLPWVAQTAMFQNVAYRPPHLYIKLGLLRVFDCYVTLTKRGDIHTFEVRKKGLANLAWYKQFRWAANSVSRKLSMQEDVLEKSIFINRIDSWTSFKFNFCWKRTKALQVLSYLVFK